MSRLKHQMHERRERILAAARSIIAESGYAGLSMRALARASQVTVPTIYNLIGSKEDVVVEAVAEQTRRFVSGLEGKADLLAVIEAAVDDFVSQPAYYRGLLPALASSSSIAGRQAQRAMRKQIEFALETAASAGSLEEGMDPGLLSQRIQTHFDATALQWSAGYLDDVAFRAAALFDVALVGVAVYRGSEVDRFHQVLHRSQSRARLQGRQEEHAVGAEA